MSRAPVYRNAEARSTVLGLSFPTEVTVVLGVMWAGMLTIDIDAAALLTIAAYGGIRALNYGRAEAFLQHWLHWQMRRLMSGGRFSAAARSHPPRCPFGPYVCRDLPKRRP